MVTINGPDFTTYYNVNIKKNNIHLISESPTSIVFFSSYWGTEHSILQVQLFTSGSYVRNTRRLRLPWQLSSQTLSYHRIVSEVNFSLLHFLLPFSSLHVHCINIDSIDNYRSLCFHFPCISLLLLNCIIMVKYNEKHVFI